MSLQLEERDGLMVPIADRHCVQVVLRQVHDLDKIIPICAQHRTAIQAGGNIGIWPIAMAKVFTNVITAEPDPANYNALLANTHRIDNILKMNLAFGQDFGKGAVEQLDVSNIGTHRIGTGDTTDVVPIDSLEVTDCDLLQLNVEGFEHFAILGAMETIKESYPVICLELKGLGEHYGAPDQSTVDLLVSLGYEQTMILNRDRVFEHSV